MTEQEIMQLARDCGIDVREPLLDVGVFPEILQRFASLVAERERQACLAEIETGIWIDKTTGEVLGEIADAIRARTKDKK